MDLLGRVVEVDAAKEVCVFAAFAGLAVLLFKDLGKRPLLGDLAFVVPVVGDVIDEKQREHLDALGPQQQLFVQVLGDGAADHLALYGKVLHVAPGLAAGLQFDFLARYLQLHDALAVDDFDGAHPAVGVHVAARGLVQLFAIVDPHFLALDPVRGSDIEHHSRRYAAALGLDPHQPHVGLVVRGLDRRRRHLDLLDQLPGVRVDRIQPVEHVVLVDMRGRIAQRAQGLHVIKSLLALAL